jgi:hypothetical protein
LPRIACQSPKAERTSASAARMLSRKEAMSASLPTRSTRIWISDSGSPLADRHELARRVARDREHRMHDAVRGQPVRGQRHAHRVDEEGHVVVDDLHDGGAASEAGPGAGIEHAHAGAARLALHRELQVRQKDRRPLRRCVLLELVDRHAREEGTAEIAGERALRGWREFLQLGEDGFGGDDGDGLGVHSTQSRYGSGKRNCSLFSPLRRLFPAPAPWLPRNWSTARV